MKYIILALIPLLFTGCIKDLTIDTQYQNKECPKPKPKPEFTPYEVVIMEINGEEYYALPKSEATKMITNWISYQEWSEANAKMMLKP